MGLLDTIASASIGAPQIGLGGPGMPGALSQIRDVRAQRPGAPQRRQAPTYRPIERQELMLLADALKNGMDPSIGAQFLQELTGGLDERVDLFRSKQADRREFRQEQMAALPGMAGQAFEMQQAGMDPSAIESAFSGVRGQAGNRLSDIIGSFGSGPGGRTRLPDEEKLGIYDQANELAASGVPLHEARRQMVGRARDLGADEFQIKETYNLIGDAYNTAIEAGGGARASLINAPLSYGEYQQGLAEPPAPPSRVNAREQAMAHSGLPPGYGWDSAEIDPQTGQPVGEPGTPSIVDLLRGLF